VLRGLVAVGLVEMLQDDSVFGGGSYALVVVAAAALAVIASVAVGLRRPRRGVALVLVNLVLVLATPVILWHAIDAGRAVVDDGFVAEAPVDPQGLVYNGAPVQNIYAFDADGWLLPDVRLFMQGGEPLEIGADAEDPNRRTVQTLSGDIAFNAFPILYFEPGTKRIADPRAGVPARPGPLTTKPVGPR
jgi:hypothetical protein